MSPNKKRRPGGGGASNNSQPSKLQADHRLVALLLQVDALPEGHCFPVPGGIVASGDFLNLAARIGERARKVSPEDPAAACKAALLAMVPGGGQ